MAISVPAPTEECFGGGFRSQGPLYFYLDSRVLLLVLMAEELRRGDPGFSMGGLATPRHGVAEASTGGVQPDGLRWGR